MELGLLYITEDVVKTSVTHSPAARVPLFCAYHISTKSVIYDLTNTRQNGIYLLNRAFLFDVTAAILMLQKKKRWPY